MGTVASSTSAAAVARAAAAPCAARRISPMKAARGKKSSACTTSAVRDVLPAAATVAIPAQIGRAFRGDLLQETPDSRSVGDGCRRRLAVDRHACLPRLLPGTSGHSGATGTSTMTGGSKRHVENARFTTAGTAMCEADGDVRCETRALQANGDLSQRPHSHGGVREAC